MTLPSMTGISVDDGETDETDGPHLIKRSKATAESITFQIVFAVFARPLSPTGLGAFRSIVDE